MTFDRKAFFDAIRPDPFHGVLSQGAVDTMGAILDEWERRKLTDLRWLAYMLATDLGECGRNMRPVREGFADSDAEARAYVKGKGYPYAMAFDGRVYYGRGIVQLTWKRNYEKMGPILGIDLLNNPDLALDIARAVTIMFEGMIRGSFTGKKLADFFSERADDPFSARQIINGSDRANEIAGYHRLFLKALRSSVKASPEDRAPPAQRPSSPPPPPPPPPPIAKRAETFFEAINRILFRKG